MTENKGKKPDEYYQEPPSIAFEGHHYKYYGFEINRHRHTLRPFLPFHPARREKKVLMPASILADARLWAAPSVMRVYTTMAIYAGSDRVCFASKDKIAAHCGIGIRRLFHVLNILCAIGAIQPCNKRHSRATAYFIPIRPNLSAAQEIRETALRLETQTATDNRAHELQRKIASAPTPLHRYGTATGEASALTKITAQKGRYTPKITKLILGLQQSCSEKLSANTRRIAKQCLKFGEPSTIHFMSVNLLQGTIVDDETMQSILATICDMLAQNREYYGRESRDSGA